MFVSFFQVFTTFFLFEAILKLAALSKEYFANGWNIFDLVIVVASLLDLGLESVDGISVMRGMRLVSLVLNIPSFVELYSNFTHFGGGTKQHHCHCIGICSLNVSSNAQCPIFLHKCYRPPTNNSLMMTKE